eukprot:4467499-Pyramimonas_sp.AAC.1
MFGHRSGASRLEGAGWQRCASGRVVWRIPWWFAWCRDRLLRRRGSLVDLSRSRPQEQAELRRRLWASAPRLGSASRASAVVPLLGLWRRWSWPLVGRLRS